MVVDWTYLIRDSFSFRGALKLRIKALILLFKTGAVEHLAIAFHVVLAVVSSNRMMVLRRKIIHCIR